MEDQNAGFWQVRYFCAKNIDEAKKLFENRGKDLQVNFTSEMNKGDKYFYVNNSKAFNPVRLSNLVFAREYQDYQREKQIVTTSSNSYSGSSSSNYNSNSYSNAKPKLYYNSSTGGMSECAHDTGVTGKCLSFKPYKASLYDKDTLFYNPSTNSMQPCIGIITVNGKCSAYGIFNYKEATADKGQLY